MRFSITSFALILVSSLLLVLPVAAQDQAAAVAAEEMVRLPEGWTIETDATPGTLRVDVVTDVAHSGGSSVVISHSQPASTTLVSKPVQLQVGKIYRVRAWVRTDGVRSDPTSRYPTAVPACISMASFPFTNHSPTAGGSNDWFKIEERFVATSAEDQIRLHLGYNGSADGTIWFDDVGLDPVTDIDDYIPLETVRWFGDGYRYDDRGWIFVHIEGEPYQRGYQYGYLVADEIVAYIDKLGIRENPDDPEAGWNGVRFAADAMMLRKYEEEYLTEMKGIADGAAQAGAEVYDRPINLLDVVAINSVVDIMWARYAMGTTPHPLSGESFLDAEDEILLAHDQAKCSAFAATGPATKSGEVVFGQIFMWYGYTGVHWNVICDVVPSSGHRLVYETYPGGIHSGADFYINSAGIIIGETTVSQTPFNLDGTPQSNRIRKAAQYASSIDEVEEILWHQNNGMYANDWPMADIKTGEVAILLLGTYAKKLWRTGEDMAPFGTPGFLWANNNNRDPEVRKEYAVQPHDAPYDLIYSPWNRDVAFNQFFQEHQGNIDAIAGVKLWASSPINRAHACDGKITTSEMARELVFLAHHGKVTLREKIPGESGRLMPDQPGAIPHLSLGYATPSPIEITKKLQAARTKPVEEEKKLDLDVSTVADRYSIERRQMWRGTVYPASEAEGWLISGTAAYWDLMWELGGADKREDGAKGLAAELAGLNARYLYTVSREDDLAPLTTSRAYDRYGPYLIPRIKGTIALHQLRLLLGTAPFLGVMRTVHEQFARAEITTEQMIATAEKVSGKSLSSFMRQWLERSGLPELTPSVKLGESDGGWDLTVKVKQGGEPYHLLTSFAVDVDGKRQVHPIEIKGATSEATVHLEQRPQRVVFNPMHDVPLANDRFYTWRNFIDDFHSTLIVYGTSRQIEANHTIGLRWQTRIADTYSEVFSPMVKDSELSPEELADHDLMVLGHATDNGLTARLADKLPVSFERNLFRWQGRTYKNSDDGLILVLPNPYNPQRVLYLIIGNSALQLYRMTDSYHRGVPSWAVFKGDKIVDQGYHIPAGWEMELPK